MVEITTGDGGARGGCLQLEDLAGKDVSVLAFADGDMWRPTERWKMPWWVIKKATGNVDEDDGAWGVLGHGVGVLEDCADQGEGCGRACELWT